MTATPASIHGPALGCVVILMLALAPALPSGAQTSQYEHHHTFVADDAGERDNFGYSVAFWNGYLFVGAVWEDDRGLDAGAVYIYTRDTFGVWYELHKIYGSDTDSGDYFGTSLAADAGRLVVGARGKDRAGLGTELTGAAYVFEADFGGGDNWGQTAKLEAIDAQTWDEFGESVDIDGERIVVGAPYHEANQFNNDLNYGAAFLFERDSPGPWQFVTRLMADDKFNQDLLGYSVAIDGDVIAVGSHMDDDGANASGSVYIFVEDWTGPGAWGQRRKVHAPNPHTADGFGWAVGFSEATLVVGTPYWDNQGVGPGSGAAFIYGRDGDAWTWDRTLLPPLPTNGDQYGYRVAIDGPRIIVGAWGVHPYGTAFVYHRDWPLPGSWALVGDLRPDEPVAGDLSGLAVAIWTDWAAVGNYNHNESGMVDAGTAYLYTHGILFWTSFETGDFTGWSAVVQ